MIDIITLRELNPEAAEMWAYDLNDPSIIPDKIAGRTDKKAYFRCLSNVDHVFQKRIGKMTADDGRSFGCIYCGPNAKSVFPGETDFLTNCPGARDMWDYKKNIEIDPTLVFPKSNKYAFFICKKGHSTYRKIFDFYRSSKCTECEKGKTKIIYQFPNTRLFWDDNMNTELNLCEIVQSSRKIVNFKCPNCNYGWNESICLWNTRRYCPCCGFDGSDESIKKNHDTISRNPVITFRMANPVDAKMWRYDLNGDITPDNILYMSNKKAYFKCENGHEFYETIFRMTDSERRPRGCPYCKLKFKKAYLGETDFFTVCPTGKEMWNFEKNIGIDPQSLVSSSGVKVHFQCSVGHEFSKKIMDFTMNPKCPKCELIYNKSIVVKRSESLIFWDYEKNILSPDKVTPYSKEEAYWKCHTCGYSWKAVIANRLTALKNKCPSCDMGRVFSKDQTNIKTFRTFNPEAARLWIDELNNGLTPDNVAQRSGKSVYLRCENNAEHIYIKKTCDIPNKKPYGCPFCQKRKIQAFPGEDDIFTICQPSKEMWDWEKNKELDPYHILPGSRSEAWFICDNAHSFKKRIGDFVDAPTCPECKKEKYTVANYPNMVKQWDFKKNTGIDINLTSASSKTNVWWKCKKCSYEWQAQIASRKLSKGLCPCCENRNVVIKGITDLFSIVPEIKQEYDFVKNKDIDSDILSVSNLTSIWWKCHICSYEWKSSPSARISANADKYQIRKCPACAGIVRVRPYADDYPELRDRFDEESNGFPIEDLTGSMLPKKLHWICDICGKKYKTSLATMIRSYNSKFRGCSYCSRTIIPRKESFGHLFPQLMEEYDPDNIVDAYEYSPISPKNVKWICKNDSNHKWSSSFVKRKGAYGGCPHCEQTERILLIDARPDLEEYYDHEKNEIAFSSLSFMSNRKAWWKCKVGHSFKKNVFSESKLPEFNCIICNNYILEKDFNDFATKYPEWIQYFDKEKNDFSPDEIKYNDYKKPVWWTCNQGHSYQQLIYARVQNKNCSICSRSIIVQGVNDFLHANPEINKIWGPNNEKKPEEHSDITNVEMDFLCEKGHHYKAFAYMIRNNGTKCLVCENKILLKEVNSYADIYPEMLSEWSSENEKKPEEILCNSNFLIKWKCPVCNFVYARHLKERYLNDDACPCCSNIRVKDDYNSFAARAPLELVAQWSNDNESKPSQVLYSTTKYYRRVCQTCNNTYSQKLSEWAIDDNSCPYCNDKETLLGFNSLVDTHQELIKEWSENNIDKPDMYRKSLTYYVIWKCPTCCGEYSAKICDREIGDDSCPYCANKKALAKFNTLEVTKPKLVAEWSPKNERPMTDFLDTSSYRALWICPVCNGEYLSCICDREVGDDSCPYCTNKKALAKFNTLEVTKPKLVAEWSPKNERPMTDFLDTSSYRALWICPVCNGEYLSCICDREVGDDSCPYCANIKPLANFNTFKKKHPDLMETWDYINNYILVNPDEILDTYMNKVWWQCENDKSHKYFMSPKQRLYYKMRHMECCTICKGYRRKRRHFI